MLTMEAPTVSASTLNRCDRCGAQAYVSVRLMTNGTAPAILMFCGHHWRTVEAKVRPIASSIVDDTGSLTAAAKSTVDA